MLNLIETLFYILVFFLFLQIILRSNTSKRRLKLDQEIYLVIENSKGLIPIFNSKVFVNGSFLIFVVVMAAYAVTKRMYVENLSSLVSVGFCVGLAYFEWYSSQQNMVVSKTGINIGVDYVDWENVESYFWKDDAPGEGSLLRVRRKSRIPFSFKVNQSDKEKLDQLISSNILR